MPTANIRLSAAEARKRVIGKTRAKASGRPGAENGHPKKSWLDWEIVLAMYIFRV